MSILFEVRKFCEEQRPCNDKCPIYEECCRMYILDPCQWDAEDVERVEEEIGRWKSKSILRAMQESADAVKASPKYDFSCVTPLMEDSVPKKGKWSNKFKSDPSSIFGTTLISTCSNCNKENSIGWTKYCPHCGVEMENGGEE